MAESFLMTLEQMFRILALLAIGYGFNKLHLVPKAAETVLSKFVIMLFLPCMLMYSYVVECDLENLIIYSRWTLCGVAFSVLFLAIAYGFGGLFERKDRYLRNIYRYALALPNTGAVAMPLLLAFFGTAGVFRYQMFIFPLVIVTYVWGVQLLQPMQGKPSLLVLILRIFNPSTVGILIGILLSLLGAKNWLPEIVLNTIGDLGDAYVVVALLLAGFTIADYPVLELLANRRTYVFTLARLILIPGLCLLLVWLTRLEPLLCTTVVLSAACPCGMNTVVFPAAYGEDCRTGAGMVLVSSALSVVTVPLMYALTGVLCGS